MSPKLLSTLGLAACGLALPMSHCVTSCSLSLWMELCGWASGSTSRFRPVVFIHAPELQAETTTLDKPSVPYPRMAYADITSSLALDLELYCSVDLNLAAASFKSSYIITLKSFRFKAGSVRVQGQMD